MLGVAMVAAPVIIAIDQLGVRGPTRQEPASLAVVPEPPPKTEAGVAVGVLVDVDDCRSDVHVTTVAEPTAEYWLAHRAKRFAKVAMVRLALPDARAHTVEFRLGESASDVVTPQDVLNRGHQGPKQDATGVEVTSLREQGETGDLLVATLTVRHWGRTLAPIIASYRADWLEERGLGSCWLRLPALTGDLTVLAAKRAVGKSIPLREQLFMNPGDFRVFSTRANAQATYTAGLEATHGSTTVVSPKAEVGASLPAPSSSTNGSPTWTCQPQPKANVRSLRSAKLTAAPDVLSGTTGTGSGAMSADVIAGSKTGDCSAVAAVIEASAGWQRDLFMLVVGTVVSLGIAILVEMLKGSRKRKAGEGGA